MKYSIILVFALFLMTMSAHAADPITLSQSNMEGIPYVLPEGYCVLGSDAELAIQSLNKVSPPSRDSIYKRVIPCADRRRVIEEHNWPEKHALIEIVPLPSSNLDISLQDKVKRADEAMMKTLFLQPFVRLIIIKSADSEKERDGAILSAVTWGGLQPVIDHSWNRFVQALKERVKDKNFISDGFLLGTDGAVIWRAGIVRNGSIILANISGTTYTKNAMITYTISGPFKTNTTYEDLKKDVRPALIATAIGLDNLEDPTASNQESSNSAKLPVIEDGQSTLLPTPPIIDGQSPPINRFSDGEELWNKVPALQGSDQTPSSGGWGH